MRKVKNKSKVSSIDYVVNPISEEALFVKAFCEMDIEKIADLLGENIDYGEVNKWGFIEDIRVMMEFFKLRKDTFFNYNNGRCLGCIKGLNVVVFSGNYSNVQWSIRLDVVEGQIKSVYECAKFEH